MWLKKEHGTELYAVPVMTDPEVHHRRLEESAAQTCQPCRPLQTRTAQLLNTVTQYFPQVNNKLRLVLVLVSVCQLFKYFIKITTVTCTLSLLLALYSYYRK